MREVFRHVPEVFDQLVMMPPPASSHRYHRRKYVNVGCACLHTTDREGRVIFVDHFFTVNNSFATLIGGLVSSDAVRRAKSFRQSSLNKEFDHLVEWFQLRRD